MGFGNPIILVFTGYKFQFHVPTGEDIELDIVSPFRRIIRYI